MAVLCKIVAATTAAGICACGVPQSLSNAANARAGPPQSAAVAVRGASTGFGDVVVGAGERIRFSLLDSKRSAYVCRNAMPLRCERRSFELDCTCPRGLPR
jgi:hypothetical protein